MRGERSEAAVDELATVVEGGSGTGAVKNIDPTAPTPGGAGPKGSDGGWHTLDDRDLPTNQQKTVTTPPQPPTQPQCEDDNCAQPIKHTKHEDQPEAQPQPAGGGAGGGTGGGGTGNCLNRRPLGFHDDGAFDAFADALHSGLQAAGYSGTNAAFQGSSVTGVNFKKGLPFRDESDYDIALGGAEIFGAASAAGISLRSRKTRTGPLLPDQLEAMGLSALAESLSQVADREVKFMIYQDIDAAISRSPSIRVPGGC